MSLVDDIMRRVSPVAPIIIEPTSIGRYTETHWNCDGVELTISGRVLDDEIRCFAAEDADGNPVRIPDAFMCDALQDLVDADRRRTA